MPRCAPIELLLLPVTAEAILAIRRGELRATTLRDAADLGLRAVTAAVEHPGG